MPYQIQLDMGQLIVAPEDGDFYIRRFAGAATAKAGTPLLTLDGATAYMTNQAGVTNQPGAQNVMVGPEQTMSGGIVNPVRGGCARRRGACGGCRFSFFFFFSFFPPGFFCPVAVLGGRGGTLQSPLPGLFPGGLPQNRRTVCAGGCFRPLSLLRAGQGAHPERCWLCAAVLPPFSRLFFLCFPLLINGWLTRLPPCPATNTPTRSLCTARQDHNPIGLPSGPPPGMIERPKKGTPLRFGVGASVMCRVTPEGQFAPGRVIQQWYREPNFPPDVFVPYQIQLANGMMIFAPADQDAIIRAP